MNVQINIRNNAHLKVGEKVICTCDVVNTDGSIVHGRGNVYTVEPDTQAYFSLFTSSVSRDWAYYLKLLD